ncbi:MAG TPA: hypothetical protein VF209_00595 [Patescibacteria group bacterium]
MSKLSLFLLSIASLILVSSVGYGIYQYLNLKKIEMNNLAVDECLKTSSYTVNNLEQGTTTVEPIESVLKKCLELKKL